MKPLFLGLIGALMAFPAHAQKPSPAAAENTTVAPAAAPSTVTTTVTTTVAPAAPATLPAPPVPVMTTQTGSSAVTAIPAPPVAVGTTPKSYLRDAITGKPVDLSGAEAEEKKEKESLRDRVRDKMKN